VNDLPNSYSTYSRYLQAPWALETKYGKQNLQKKYEGHQYVNRISLNRNCLCLVRKSVRCWRPESLKAWGGRDLPMILALEGRIQQLNFHFQHLLLRCSKKPPDCVSFVLHRMEMYVFQVALVFFPELPLLLWYFVKRTAVPLVEPVLLG